MNKKVAIPVICLLIIIAFGTLYIFLNRNNINVKDQNVELRNIKIERLGNRKDSEIDLNSHLFKNYDEYKEYMKNYDKELVLKESDFKKFDYILDFHSFSKCNEEKDKKIKSIDIEESIMIITFEVYNKCYSCDNNEEEGVAYLIPIKKNKLKELIPIMPKYEKQNANLTC